MGLFENIKKFADEVTDTDSCSLGDQVSDSALKKQLQAIVDQDDDSQVSTTEIQHKKIENLQTNLGLDYHKTIFFIDTTKMRHNGSRGIGSTIDSLYWNFSNEDAHHIFLTDLVFCNLSETKLTRIMTADDDQVVTQTFDFSTTVVPTIKQIKALFDTDETTKTNYQSKIDTMLQHKQLSTESLQQLELLEITTISQHTIIETKLINQAFSNNDWSSIATNLTALNINDTVVFESNRQTVLKKASERIDSNDDISRDELVQLNYLLNEFDYDHLYINEIIKLQVRLGKGFEAKITAYARLDAKERDKVIREISQTEEKTRRRVETAVEQADSDYFESYQAQANLALTAGLLPVEYALLLKKSADFVNELMKLTDSDLLANPSNVYQFSLEELAASHQSKDYFLATASNDNSRPQANIIDKMSHKVLRENARTIKIAQKQGQDVSEAVQKYNNQAERVNQSDQELAEAQREWDNKTSAELDKNYHNFYYELTGINTSALKNILRNRYLSQTQNDLNTITSQLDYLTDNLNDLQHTLNNPIDDLVNQRYNANKLVRGEFEKAEDFEHRVLECRQNLKREVTQNLDDKIAQLTQEFNKKAEKKQQLAQHKKALVEKFEFGDQIIDDMLNEITEPSATSFIKKIIFDSDLSNLSIGKYDPDTFTFVTNSPLGSSTVEVPIEVAPQFRENFYANNVTDFRITHHNDDYWVLAVYPFEGTVYRIPMEKLLTNEASD